MLNPFLHVLERFVVHMHVHRIVVFRMIIGEDQPIVIRVSATRVQEQLKVIAEFPVIRKNECAFSHAFPCLSHMFQIELL